MRKGKVYSGTLTVTEVADAWLTEKLWDTFVTGIIQQKRLD